MHIPEYTISPKLRDAMQDAFEPFLHEQIDGVALSEWLNEPHTTPLPTQLRLKLGTTLNSVLGLEGGQQGGEILNAMDGILNNGGAPAILLHGLPATAVSPIIREAFRQTLFADPAHGHAEPQHVRDLRATDTASRYKKTGTKYFHQHGSDTIILAGIRSGANPRHTVIADAREFTDYILSKMPADTSKGMDPQTLSDQCIELLQLPIWPVLAMDDPAKVFLPVPRAAKLLAEDAQREGKLHQVKKPVAIKPAPPTQGIFRRLFKRGRNTPKSDDQEKTLTTEILSQPDVTSYAPIIYPNPDFHPDEAGSVPYRFFKAPFSYLYERMLPEMSLVPEHLRPAAECFVKALFNSKRNDVTLKQGPVLGEGDMLIFNNRLLIHAGGPHIHDFLQEEPASGTSREIVGIDVFSPRHGVYPVRPGDHVAKPIRMGTLGPEIDASLGIEH